MIGFCINADGNTLTGGGKVNTWDSQNRLVKVVKAGVTSEFTYGSDGLRRRSLVTNAAGEATQTDYIYDATMMVAEVVKHFNGGAQVGQTENVSYLQGPQGPLYRKSSLQADPKWYVYDGLGSVVGEVDVLGNLSATKTHDVYGLTRGVTGTPTSRQGFVGSLGHISDDETGLVYMRARYYDPSVGRFESQDPSLEGNNWFSYCDGNPVNRLDQNGKSWSDITKVLAQLWSEFDSAAAFDLRGGAGAILITGVAAYWCNKNGHPVEGAALQLLAAMIGFATAVAAFAAAAGPIGLIAAFVVLAVAAYFVIDGMSGFADACYESSFGKPPPVYN